MRYNIKVAARYGDHHFEVWLSLVERFVRDEEVVGSNPVAPIFLYPFLVGKEDPA